jgi:hypothetical protein
LVVHQRRGGGPERDGEILEVPHADGSPPFVVQWSDTGHETLIFPGPDAEVHHFEDEAPSS